MDHQEYVAGFLFDRIGSQVALVRKQRPEWQKGLLNGIGGKVEKGEEPFDAMCREFREETAVSLTNWKRFCVLSGRGFTVYFYFAHDDQSVLDMVAKSNHDEPIGIYFTQELRTDRACVPNIHWLIPMALEREVNREIHNGYEVQEV